jgi:hydrogenase nickel incorporation protein HypA/HybF
MHELSIALQIVATAAEALRNQRGDAVAVHVRLGALAGVVADALQSAWECARVGSPLAASALVLEEVSATAWCTTCNAEREVESLQHFRCAQCGSPAGQVIHGRELEIVALEVADDADDATG